MLVDARSLTDGTVVEADVCVVGAGPAGLTVTAALAERGVRVCLVERGGPAPPPASATDHAPIPDEVDGCIAYPADAAVAEAIGGTSHLWNVHTDLGAPFVQLRELDPADFEPKPWVPLSGWPIGPTDLAEGWSRARRQMALPPAGDRPVDPLAPGIVDTWFDFGPAAPFSTATGWLGAAVPVTTLHHATAAEVRAADGTDRITDLWLRTGEGRCVRVQSRVYVLAAGGVETPRLLLSSTADQPRGVGNAEGLVGRCFMEHPHFPAGLLWPDDRRLLEDVTLGEIHVRDGAAVQRRYRVDDGRIAGHRLLGCAFQLRATPLTPYLRHLAAGRPGAAGMVALQALRDRDREVPAGRLVGRVARHAPALARHAGRRLLPRRGPRAFLVSCMAEQRPDPASRVVLGDAVDDLGLRRAEVQWRLTAEDLRSMGDSQRLLAASVRRSGLGRYESWVDGHEVPPGLSGGHHLMGTTRMATDPRRGVVDRDGRVHGTRNLYVAGSGVFPTSGYANPTLTILALGHRLADHVVSLAGVAV